MDELDKRILIDLRRNCRISYQELSRKYGISANAIRRRIMNLEESGVISGYSIALSPAMTDTDFLFALLETDGSRDEVEMVDEIGSSRNVLAAAAYTDGVYALVAEYNGLQELQELGKFLRTLDGVQTAELHTFIRTWGDKMNLTKTHLRVLEPLLEDPRLPIVEIAQKTGLTARRVRRLIRELEESGAIRFSALAELGAATSLPYIVRITWDEKMVTYSTITDWLSKDFALKHWETYVSASEPILFTLLVADDLTDLTETVRVIRQNKHVASAKALIGGYHKYFSSYRHKKLVQMVREREKANV
ncbi:MAG: winged helix-turn-helix transcriptional regulator [Candidatus Thorarchaeota archaeon]